MTFTACIAQIAIQAANTGLNGVIDGDMIRISIPQLTEERRRELVKSVKQKITKKITIER